MNGKDLLIVAAVCLALMSKFVHGQTLQTPQMGDAAQA